MLIYWLRNDFRLNDNEALSYLLSSENDNFIFFHMIKKNINLDQLKNGGFIKHLKFLIKN